jgi:hypothetical protein
VWISGDTVLYDGVRHVAERVDVGTAIVHLGSVHFPITGPIKFTMTAKDAVELCQLLRPNTAVPVHHEGWSHFKQGRQPTEHELAGAPADVSSSPSRSGRRSAGRSESTFDIVIIGQVDVALVAVCKLATAARIPVIVATVALLAHASRGRYRHPAVTPNYQRRRSRAVEDSYGGRTPTLVRVEAVALDRWQP